MVRVSDCDPSAFLDDNEIWPQPYCAVQPPSTTRLVPVIMCAAGEARKTIAPATSSAARIGRAGCAT